MPDLTQIALATGFGLILIGFYGALTRRSLLRIILAFTLASTGVNVVIVAIGYMRGRAAPILDEAVTTTTAVGRVIDPLPQALVLTAIVIGLGVTALMLAHAYRLFLRHGTLDIAAFRELKW